MKENSIEDRIEEKYTRYLNCETDIIDLTLEEAVFILEKDKKNHYVDGLLQVAYGMILSDYKRVLKENEELKSDNYELNNRINDLLDNIPIQKVKDKIEELEEKRIKMEKEDIGVGFTLGEEWSDLKSKIKAYKDLLEEKGE